MEYIVYLDCDLGDMFPSCVYLLLKLIYVLLHLRNTWKMLFLKNKVKKEPAMWLEEIEIRL